MTNEQYFTNRKIHGLYILFTNHANLQKTGKLAKKIYCTIKVSVLIHLIYSLNCKHNSTLLVYNIAS